MPHNSRWPKVLIFAATGAVLGACASYGEVKELDVVSSFEVTGVSSEALSACVHELIKEEGAQIYHRSYDPIRKKWFIIAEFRTVLGSGNGSYNFSVSFDSFAEAKTKLEIRSLKTVWGQAQAPSERIIEMTRKCGYELKIADPRKR